MMYEIQAYAVRHNDEIEVTITGKLADSCHQAIIEDFYPGGNRQYVQDPGAAQVFIKETRNTNSNFCIFTLFPWTATVSIQDKHHDKVEIHINEDNVFETPVLEIDAPTSHFIVIALTVYDGEQQGGCSILPEGSFYPAIYSQCFGPDTYQNCQSWVNSNCESR